ncbi:MAG: DUF481 domain-containing protein [Flavobacteriaceae bacterium]
MKCLKYLLILLTGIGSLYGQIVNVESLRLVSDSLAWSGNVGLDLGLTKNNTTSFNIASGVHIQYSKEKNLVLFVSNLNFQQVSDNKFVNRGIFHFRYNYKATKRLAWELFTQGQYDAISEIAFRGLLGTGPRFTIRSSKTHEFNMGTLVMYEYEKTSEEESVIHRDLRGSAYLAASLHPNERISLVSTTYYQPKLSRFGDFRISNDTTFAVKIFQNLDFSTTFSLIYDTAPAQAIPKTQYELTNGLVYSFN